MKTTRHFEEDVKPKRPYLTDEMVQRVVTNPERKEVQIMPSTGEHRIRHWAFVAELGKYLRVVTLDDGETVHTAYPDRDYRP